MKEGRTRKGVSGKKIRFSFKILAARFDKARQVSA